MLKLDDLYETWDDEVIPLPEREPVSPVQQQWADNGCVYLEDAVPEELLLAYESEWLLHNGGEDAVPGIPATYKRPRGWDYATPYVNHPALRAVACSSRLASTMQEILGEPAGVHLNLTGWVSTRRDWHRDQYLNEPYVGGYYVAVWLALADISPDAGPFQYVMGSHKGSPISQKLMRDALGEDGHGPDWPSKSERILTPLFEQEIKDKKLKVSTLTNIRRGDALLWHGRLLHRGSTPKNPDLERRSLIMHYSGIFHRPDMPSAVQHRLSGWLFPLGGRQPVD